MREILSPQQIAKEGKSAYRKGDFTAAAQSFEAARQAYLSANQPVMAAEMANNCSVAYLQAGDNEAALAAVDGTDLIFIEAGDRKREAMALGNRAAALEALDRLEEAEQFYEKAADIFKELGEDDLRLPLMQSISAIQLRTGRQLQAVASMYAGVQNIQKPTVKQRFLKGLLGIPIRILNEQWKKLPDGTNDNPQ
jgi:tetratricopeptide (TPR) repeat protein